MPVIALVMLAALIASPAEFCATGDGAADLMPVPSQLEHKHHGLELASD